MVNGCTRLQPVVMQLGQVAALAVYLAKKHNMDVDKIDVTLLQDLILGVDGYLYPTHDVSPDNPSFKDIQKNIRDGKIKLEYYSEGWVNKARIIYK